MHLKLYIEYLTTCSSVYDKSSKILTHLCNNVAIVPLFNLLWGYCTKSCLVRTKCDKHLSIVVSIVSFQLENCTDHRGVHPQGIMSTQALSPTLRCCEGEIRELEGMGETVCLVLVGLKDREESKEYSRSLRSKEWWGRLHKVGKNQLPKCHLNWAGVCRKGWRKLV